MRIIPILKYRFVAIGSSLFFIIIFGIGTFIRGGFNMGIDFAGGVKIAAKFSETVNEGKIRSLLKDFNATVQQIGSSEKNEFIISTKLKEGSATKNEPDQIKATLKKKYKDIQLISIEKFNNIKLAVKIPEKTDVVKINNLLKGYDLKIEQTSSKEKNEYIISMRLKSKEALQNEVESIKETLKKDINTIKFLNYENFGSLKIVAKFAKSIDEADIKDSLKQFNPEVQRDPKEKNECIIFTEFKEYQDVSQRESEQIKNVLSKRYKDVTFLSVENIGPTVGDYLKKSAIQLIIISMLLMTVYLTFRFEFKYSVGAMTALIHDITISVVFCGILGIEINVPIIAALLTIFGYSVNDTIVIFDRIRENVQFETKYTMVEVIDKSINQSFSRTLLTSLTTIFAVFAIYLLGEQSLNDFALVLLFGITIGTYSSIYIASPIVAGWERISSK